VKHPAFRHNEESSCQEALQSSITPLVVGGNMDQEFTFEMRPFYIHVHIAPGFKITLKSTTHLWSQLQKICLTHQYKRVICEGINPTREMNLQDMYDCAKTAAHMLFGLHVAFYWQGYQTDQLTDVFKTVAENKGVYFGFFEQRAEALDWLGIPPETTADQSAALKS
jgi:hypothetical protein